MIQIVVTNRD